MQSTKFSNHATFHLFPYLRAPRPVALPGVCPDAELVLGVVVQVGEHSLALGRGAHALLLGLNSLELKLCRGVEKEIEFKLNLNTDSPFPCC